MITSYLKLDWRGLKKGTAINKSPLLTKIMLKRGIVSLEPIAEPKPAKTAKKK